MYRPDRSVAQGPGRGVPGQWAAGPVGHHSADLQQMLNVVRADPFPGKYVLLCTKPHREWVLGRSERGARRPWPVEVLEEAWLASVGSWLPLVEQVFSCVEDAEWAVFKRRWTW